MDRNNGRSNNSAAGDDFSREFKTDMHNFYKGVKEGLPGDTDQEKMMKIGRGSVKAAKGVFIVKMIIFILVLLVAAAIIVMTASVLLKQL